MDDVGVEPSNSERDVFADEREELESSDSPASDPFRPDPVDYRFLPADSNVYRHHFDIPFFKYLTPIHDDFKAAHRRKVSSCLVSVMPCAPQSPLWDLIPGYGDTYSSLC